MNTLDGDRKMLVEIHLMAGVTGLLERMEILSVKPLQFFLVKALHSKMNYFSKMESTLMIFQYGRNEELVLLLKR